MTGRNIVLSLHILLAVLLIGWLAMTSMFTPALIRGGRATLLQLRFVHQGNEKLGRLSGSVLLVGLLLVYMSRDDFQFSFRQGWLAASLVLFIGASVIGGVFETKAIDAAIARIEADEAVDDLVTRVRVLGIANALILVTIVYLMVAKPGWP